MMNDDVGKIWKGYVRGRIGKFKRQGLRETQRLPKYAKKPQDGLVNPEGNLGPKDF